MSSLFQDSEIAPLEEVVIHEPGPEVEQMTPETARELLYNDIVPGEVVRREHRLFRDLLARYTSVVELRDLLTKALEKDEGRAFVEGKLSGLIPEVTLRKESAPELAADLIEGIPTVPRSFAEYLSRRPYDLPPLPNLYFMRDSAFVFRDTLFVGSMTHAVRQGETVLTEAAIRYGRSEPPRRVVELSQTVEGGDIVILSPTLLVAGISERSSAAGLDHLASEAAIAAGEPVRVIGVVLPHRRSTIHLDMVFTQIDHDLALVHARSVDNATVVSLTSSPSGSRELREELSLSAALEAAGKPTEFIPCGGEDPVSEAREQWLAAANTFALAPGAVVTFEANSATNGRLEEAGFRKLLVGSDELPPMPLTGRYAFALPGVDLARGGGGPRCMTLPIRRSAGRSVVVG